MKITLFYDHVTVLDYAYLDEHRGAVGHSQVVDVEFVGETDDEGVLYDFSHAKKKVKEIIDRDCDHRFVVPQKIINEKDGKFYFNYSYGFDDSVMEYWGPEEAYCEIPFDHVSDNTLVSYLESQVMKEMPKTVRSVKLKLRSELLSSNDSFFHYTHGLKDHYGNCQRLIHGHRSTLKVYVNGKRDLEKEEILATKMFASNIHFCFWENVVNKDEVKSLEGIEEPVGRLKKTPIVHIRYRSSQGEFEAKLPGNSIYMTPSETTVENLSIHFSQILKKHYLKDGEEVRVHAFEGIGKGSISTLV